MTASEQFLRFAADCQSMATLKPDRQSELVWRQLAERWTRCAEWAERENLAAQNAQLQRQKRKRDNQAERRFVGDEAKPNRLLGL
jgi:hypothetical protein